MTAAWESTTNDRIVVAMSALGLLAVIGALTGHTHAGVVKDIVNVVKWIAENSSGIRSVVNGVLSIANGLAAIWA